jgi:hypothetical protein
VFCVSTWPGFAVTIILVALCMGGCATTQPRPYLLSPDGIGVAVTSVPKSELGGVPNASRNEAVQGAMAAGAGAVFLGPLVLLVAPFTAAYGAAHGASCDQKLEAAYPGLSEKFSEIVQREVSLEDVQDQFIAVLQPHTSVRIAKGEILYDGDKASREQELVAAAARNAQAHLILVEINSISVVVVGDECESWWMEVRMRIQLWSVVDRKRVLYFDPAVAGHLLVKGSLSEMRATFDEPGAIRKALVPMFETAANTLRWRANFQLPP